MSALDADPAIGFFQGVVLIAGACLALVCNLYQVFIFKIPKCDVSFGRFEIVESTLYI
jgi:hypothetical protein